MPKVLNMRNLKGPPDLQGIYVGRPSEWGNPFSIGKNGTREEVMQLFRTWVMLDAQTRLREKARTQLRGKNLICWCWPADCHAAVWLEIANS